MRAQVVLLDADRILMARHEKGSHAYWVLPGGAIEDGETPEEAAVRELREETGLDVTLERLLFVEGPRITPDVVIRNPRYTFLGRIVGGELRAPPPEEEGQHGRLIVTEWLPVDREFDAATMDTLRQVSAALAGQADAPE